jgi:hypothetical protein
MFKDDDRCIHDSDDYSSQREKYEDLYKVLKRVFSFFVYGPFILPYLMIYLSVCSLWNSLDVVCQQIFYCSYRFLDIKGSKCGLHPTFRIFILSPTFISLKQWNQ